MNRNAEPPGLEDDVDLATLQARLEEARFQLELSTHVNRRLEQRLRTAEESVDGIRAERDNLRRRLDDHAAVSRIAARAFRIYRKLRDQARKAMGG